MDPLASVQDVEARLGREFTDTEAARVNALLQDVSANVRRVSTQIFTIVEDDVVVLRRGRHGKIRLPQRPVTDVASVVDVYGNSLAFVRVNEILDLNCYPLNTFELEPYRWMTDPDQLTVTYTHGGDVPDVIVGVVCSIVCRALGTDPDKSGIIQQQIDGYMESLGSAGAQGPVGMLASEQEICESFKRPSSPVLLNA